MAEQLSALLTGWKLPAPVVNAFIEQDWTIDSLKLIGEDAVKTLITKEGPRAIFFHHFHLWKHSNNSNDDLLTDDEDDYTANNNRSKKRKLDSAQLQALLAEPDINDLHKTLKASLPGLMVLGHYKANKGLDHYSRDLLCSQVLFKELVNDFNKKFERVNYYTMATEIVTLFPTESKETWYDVVKKGNSSTVQGRLRYKYYSIRRGLLKSQLILGCNEENPDATADSTFTDLSEDADDPSFMWLLENYQPWDEVIEKWQETYLRRKKHLLLT